jgi:hypothetical protein
VDDGSYSFTVVAAELPALLRATLPPGPPLLQASSQVSAGVSPDGQRLLLRRVVPGAAGQRDVRLSVAPFPAGPEAPVNLAGQLVNAFWTDSVTIATSTYSPTGLRLAQVDVRTGSVGNSLELPDSTVAAMGPLPRGWAWIPRTADRIIVQAGETRRETPKPAWYSSWNGVEASPDGGRLMLFGWGAATEDSVRFEVMPIGGGPPVPWFTSFAESATASWLEDGALLVAIWSAEQSVSLFKVRGPGQVEPLGRIPHPVNRLTVSGNLGRATIGWREYKGDAWMYRVVKP